MSQILVLLLWAVVIVSGEDEFGSAHTAFLKQLENRFTSGEPGEPVPASLQRHFVYALSPGGNNTITVDDAQFTKCFYWKRPALRPSATIEPALEWKFEYSVRCVPPDNCLCPVLGACWNVVRKTGLFYMVWSDGLGNCAATPTSSPPAAEGGR